MEKKNSKEVSAFIIELHDSIFVERTNVLTDQISTRDTLLKAIRLCYWYIKSTVVTLYCGASTYHFLLRLIT
jgi:hypothetical protein